jgi:hypothetical protein
VEPEQFTAMFTKSPIGSFRGAKTLLEGRMRLSQVSCCSCKVPALSNAHVVDMRTRLLRATFGNICKIKEARGWRTCDTCAQNGTLKDFLGTRLSQCFFFLFLLPDQLLCIVKNMYVYTPISDCVQTVYQLPLLPNNSAVKHIYTNRSGAKYWLDIYHWGVGLAVTGRIRDIGHNVLQYCFETGSSSSPVTATLCSLSHSSRRILLEI